MAGGVEADKMVQGKLVFKRKADDFLHSLFMKTRSGAERSVAFSE
jgi:hypothetical protein